MAPAFRSRVALLEDSGGGRISSVVSSLTRNRPKSANWTIARLSASVRRRSSTRSLRPAVAGTQFVWRAEYCTCRSVSSTSPCGIGPAAKAQTACASMPQDSMQCIPERPGFFMCSGRGVSMFNEAIQSQSMRLARTLAPGSTARGFPAGLINYFSELSAGRRGVRPQQFLRT